jgi:hypothetical protein
MNSGQRALIRAARTCRNEAVRADRFGRRQHAASLRGSARRALREAGQGGDEPLISAIGCVKNACDLAASLPDRDADTDLHDSAVAAVHGHVQSGRSYLEQHLNPAGLPRAARRRRRGSGSGTPPSGSDGNQPYDVVSGHPDLLRALDCLHKADVESDRLSDLLDGDESERDKSAADLHFHVKSADDALQSYRDAIIANPEEAKRRGIARAYAKVLSVGLH